MRSKRCWRVANTFARGCHRRPTPCRTDRPPGRTGLRSSPAERADRQELRWIVRGGGDPISGDRRDEAGRGYAADAVIARIGDEEIALRRHRESDRPAELGHRRRAVGKALDADRRDRTHRHDPYAGCEAKREPPDAIVFRHIDGRVVRIDGVMVNSYAARVSQVESATQKLMCERLADTTGLPVNQGSISAVDRIGRVLSNTGSTVTVLPSGFPQDVLDDPSHVQRKHHPPPHLVPVEQWWVDFEHCYCRVAHIISRNIDSLN